MNTPAIVSNVPMSSAHRTFAPVDARLPSEDSPESVESVEPVVSDEADESPEPVEPVDPVEPVVPVPVVAESPVAGVPSP